MLIQFEKKILKICNTEFKSGENITFFKLSQHMPGTSPKGILDCCESLRKKGYFLLSPQKNGDVIVELTFEGTHYRQIRYTEVKDFLLKSVFVPIVVSAVTTLVTLWLKSLLQ